MNFIFHRLSEFKVRSKNNYYCSRYCQSNQDIITFASRPVYLRSQCLSLNEYVRYVNRYMRKENHIVAWKESDGKMLPLLLIRKESCWWILRITTQFLGTLNAQLNLWDPKVESTWSQLDFVSPDCRCGLIDKMAAMTSTRMIMQSNFT